MMVVVVPVADDDLAMMMVVVPADDDLRVVMVVVMVVVLRQPHTHIALLHPGIVVGDQQRRGIVDRPEQLGVGRGGRQWRCRRVLHRGVGRSHRRKPGNGAEKSRDLLVHKYLPDVREAGWPQSAVAVGTRGAGFEFRQVG